MKSQYMICIPKHRAAGYTAARPFIIATDSVGIPLNDVGGLVEQEHWIVLPSLLSVHNHGYFHDDP